jgi:cytochrome c-type biogenesis protein CcmH
MAPCCWNQTLEIHDSKLASALRVELRGRLSRGETSQAIEHDLVRRYGPRILAAPGEGDSRQHIVWITALAMSLALVALVIAALRWRARASAVPTPLAAPESSATDARFDAIIDADLESRSV